MTFTCMSRGCAGPVGSLLYALVYTILFALLGVNPVYAGETGKIAGRVTDAATGEPLPGVNVVIVGTTQGAVTDADGYYAIIKVDPGTYSVQASIIGYARTTVQEVRVQIDRTTDVDFSMQEETLQAGEVVVVAEREVIQIDRTTTTSYVDSEQLDVLPVIDVQEAIELQAGVVAGRFRGGRAGEVAYLVNGVPINNVYDRGASFEVEQNMVNSIEVISGVFNAEYGQALSGVVNIVTKDVPDVWSGGLRSYAGGIASTRDLEFVDRLSGPGSGLGVGDFQSRTFSFAEASPLPSITNVEASLGGPLILDKLGFNVAGRYLDDNGHLLGKRLFMPNDASEGLNTGEARETWDIASTGDGDFVALNASERLSINGNVVYNLTPRVQLDYSVFFQDSESLPYLHAFKYVPDGINRSFLTSWNHIAGLDYTIGQKTFGSVSYSYLEDRLERRLYEDPVDLRLAPREQAGISGQFAFNVAGNELFQQDNKTLTHTVVASLTSQVNRVHQVKGGLEVRYSDLDIQRIGIENSSTTNFQPVLSTDPSVNKGFNSSRLQNNPLFFAAYLQDKIELNNLIVNAGLRFDYFDPDYEVPVDWALGANERIPDLSTAAPGDSISNRTDADVKVQVSPRIGVAFPISSQGVLRFSAGLFFQTPPFQLIYTNPEFEINDEDGIAQFGNANMEPERTLAFEVGFQQALNDQIGLEATVFSKDVRNLSGIRFLRDANGRNITQFINRDFGTIRGFTLSLFQQPGGVVSWTLDYTLQFAEGSSSDAEEEFDRFQSGQEANFTLQRLNWDQRHTLNNTISLRPTDGLSITVLNQLQSNTPYTTERNFVVSFDKNNADKPAYFTSDIRFLYRPAFVKQDVRLFLEVLNIFDERPQLDVYNDTGEATSSAELERQKLNETRVGGLNTLDEFFFRQDWLGAPRTVNVGLDFRF